MHTLLHSRLGARLSDVDVTRSLKAGQKRCREQRSFYMTGVILDQAHT